MLLALIAIAFPSSLVLAGASEVSEPMSFQTGLFTGSVGMSIPIEVEPGTGGFQPNLGISYSSQSLDELGINEQPGWLGLGWNTGGVNDRIIKVGEDDYKMVFLGTAYDLVWSSNGWNTNPQTFIKVERRSDHWTATATDGTIFVFGNTDDSRLNGDKKNGTTSWHLDEVENVDGIKIRHFYKKYINATTDLDRSIIPERIVYSYGKNGKIIGNKREIIFKTSERCDANEVYKKDGYWDDQKLDSIEIRINDVPIRKYAMDYSCILKYAPEKNFENPSFETGDLKGWNKYSERFNKVEVLGGGKYGQYYLNMHFDGYSSMAQVWQKVKVPRSTPQLQYKLEINDPWDKFEGLKVFLHDSSKEYEVDYVKSAYNWEKQYVDLSKWAGQEVTIYFRAENNIGDEGAGDVRIDDISLGGDSSASESFLTLKSITQWGSNGMRYTKTLPPITFGYNGENLLNRTENGIGGRQNYEYESFLSHTEYSDTYVKEDKKRHRVTASSSDDGLGGISTTHYAYKNDLYNLEDDEFRGHGQVDVTYPSGEASKNFFHQDDEKKGTLYRTELWGSDGKLYSVVSSTIEARKIQLSIPARDQPRNPGFEKNLMGWKDESTGNAFVQSSTESYHNESYSAKFLAGGSVSNKGAAILTQERDIPSDAKYLSFWGRLVLSPPGSEFRVLLDDAGKIYEIKSSISEDEWKEYRTDISQWAGKKVTIIFEASQQYEKAPEIMAFIDDVAFLHKTSLVSEPLVLEIREYSFSAKGESKMKLATFDHDDFGNIVNITEFGEFDEVKNKDIGFDKRQTVTEYINDDKRNILGLPKEAKVYGFDAFDNFVLQSKSRMYYDGKEFGKLKDGKLTGVDSFKDADNFVSIKMGYDDFGNPAWTDDAKGNINPETGHTNTIEYDNVYQTYPVKSCNALNFCGEIGYDVMMRPNKTIDANGVAIEVAYEDFGRVSKEAKFPDTLDFPTSETVYSDEADLSLKEPSYEKKILKDGTADGLISFRLFDGFRNVVQTRSEGAGKDEWLTSDKYFCGDSCSGNSRGRLDRSSVAYTALTSDPEKLSRKGKSESGVWTIAGYDPIGRPDLVLKPDGTSTGTAYGAWSLENFDAMKHKTASYRNGLDQTVVVENYLGNGTENYKLYAVTRSKYNTGTGELVKITDPAGNEITLSFNMLGWKTNLSDPDLGDWSYMQDDNGNVILQTDAKKQSIKFKHDELDRLIGKDYPGAFDTEYGYDACPNGKGKLCFVDSYSGKNGKYHINNSFEYDSRGRVNGTTLTINGISWTTNETHDSMDRIVNVTYPDGETVTHRYNKAGNIGSPNGGKIPAIQSNMYGSYTYVLDATYKNGKTGKVKYGNGRISERFYNDNVCSADISNGRVFTYTLQRYVIDGDVQFVEYGHDDNGNIVKLLDSLEPFYSADYELDDLARLVAANSTIYGSINFSYNNAGNIMEKDGMSYSYPKAGSRRPHAPISFKGKNLGYDANGNMISPGDSRTFEFDFENMLSGISINGAETSAFGYIEGKRAVKEENGTTTYYAGNYEEEWRNKKKEKITKYYPAIDATAKRTINVGRKNSTLEFVHKDYLGSSSKVTDEKGQMSLGIGFKPYGEDAQSIDRNAGVKYLFTGKEKDLSGLYYYGARYYDPDLARFISPDSMEGPNRYEYAKNNPVNMIDPSGHFVIAAAAIPYIVAALPTVTLVTTGYLAANWEQPVVGEFTGADVMSFAIPFPIPIGGKAKLVAPYIKRMDLGAEHADEVAKAWQKWTVESTDANGQNLVNVLSKEFDLANVKSGSIQFVREVKQDLGNGFTRFVRGYAEMNIPSWKPAFLFNWKEGAKNIKLTEYGLETIGHARATIAHELQHAKDWTGGVPMSMDVLESRGHLVGAMTHVAEAAKNPSEIAQATGTWLKANDYVVKLETANIALHDYAIYAWNKMDELFASLKSIKDIR